MLKKIISIKNIGKFKKYEASDVSLTHFVGIYSANGKGKTTLTAILRSLAKNNPRIILGRRRLNESGPPHFKTETDAGFREFADNKWDQSYNDFEIFDSHFINENLYSGMQVDITQKRNLYKFIIGDEAIRLNEEVVRLNNQISECTSKLRDKKNEIIKLAGAIPDLPVFLGLQQIDDLDLKIGTKEKEVTALKKKDALSKKEILELISPPKYNLDSLANLLLKTLDGISEDAEAQTKQHIADCLLKTGEEWLKIGMGYLCWTDWPLSSMSLIPERSLTRLQVWREELRNSLRT